tara:strand:- start:45 stop:617 length:573 start_codon:yes stop_codon:yes gene_type:complete
MGSWGATTTDEAKPKYLTDAEKRDAYATTGGWTQPLQGISEARKLAAKREVLVAVRNLSGGTSSTAKLAKATISSVRFITTALDASAGDAEFNAEVVYNEAVDITGTPQLTVLNTPGTNLVLDYLSGTGTNRLIFTENVAGGVAAADDVLSIAANSLALNSGTIKDKGTSINSIRTHDATVASANITVTA